MNDFDILSSYLPNFLLILLRTSIFMSIVTPFGSKTLPAQFKIGFAVAIALVLTPIIKFDVSTTEIPVIVIQEIMFGIVLGSAAKLIFYAVDIAGRIMSGSMGLSIATAFNPDIGESTEVSTFYWVIIMLVFFATDAHHDLIYIFARSYELLPSGHININNLIVDKAVSVGSKMFIIALKISAPLIIIMLISNLLLGFIYKASPQMNIFFISFPIYIFVGFFVMLIGLPVFINISSGYLSAIKDEMARVIAVSKD